MSSILIAESGSTKTDWCLLRTGKRPVYFKTTGINPYLQSPEEILEQLNSELKPDKYHADKLYYYGAGAESPDNQKTLKDIFRKFFGKIKVDVNTDMMAAARALAGKEKGVVAILGTGSNSCYYDGKTIRTKKPSLGYIAGDEGSGNHMGKRVLRYYAYNTFDEELKAAFEQLYESNINKIKHKLYKEPFPNRYLAEFVRLLAENRGHYMVENIIEDSLNEFFHTQILKYRESWKMPLHFTGAVAYEFRDVIKAMCRQCELTVGNIERSPLKGLVKYHQEEL